MTVFWDGVINFMKKLMKSLLLKQKESTELWLLNHLATLLKQNLFCCCFGQPVVNYQIVLQT